MLGQFSNNFHVKSNSSAAPVATGGLDSVENPTPSNIEKSCSKSPKGTVSLKRFGGARSMPPARLAREKLGWCVGLSKNRPLFVVIIMVGVVGAMILGSFFSKSVYAETATKTISTTIQCTPMATGVSDGCIGPLQDSFGGGTTCAIDSDHALTCKDSGGTQWTCAAADTTTTAGDMTVIKSFSCNDNPATNSGDAAGNLASAIAAACSKFSATDVEVYDSGPNKGKPITGLSVAGSSGTTLTRQAACGVGAGGGEAACSSVFFGIDKTQAKTLFADCGAGASGVSPN